MILVLYQAERFVFTTPADFSSCVCQKSLQDAYSNKTRLFLVVQRIWGQQVARYLCLPEEKQPMAWLPGEMLLLPGQPSLYHQDSFVVQAWQVSLGIYSSCNAGERKAAPRERFFIIYSYALITTCLCSYFRLSAVCGCCLLFLFRFNYF